MEQSGIWDYFLEEYYIYKIVQLITRNNHILKWMDFRAAYKDDCYNVFSTNMCINKAYMYNTQNTYHIKYLTIFYNKMTQGFWYHIW